MCKVPLRFAPGTTRPLILAAVRDEFADRPWDPPGEHRASAPGLVGGRDRGAGGTWLAVSPTTLSPSSETAPIWWPHWVSHPSPDRGVREPAPPRRLHRTPRPSGGAAVRSRRAIARST